ncbi:MAG: hypothetical protein LBH37_01335 [Oscillospiraceae bacterium]|jgi:hypothetical protein|nr:hypothetical protein [Oscillospiraceae bacterium]
MNDFKLLKKNLGIFLTLTLAVSGVFTSQNMTIHMKNTHAAAITSSKFSQVRKRNVSSLPWSKSSSDGGKSGAIPYFSEEEQEKHGEIFFDKKSVGKTVDESEEPEAVESATTPPAFPSDSAELNLNEEHVIGAAALLLSSCNVMLEITGDNCKAIVTAPGVTGDYHTNLNISNKKIVIRCSNIGNFGNAYSVPVNISIANSSNTPIFLELVPYSYDRPNSMYYQSINTQNSANVCIRSTGDTNISEKVTANDNSRLILFGPQILAPRVITSASTSRAGFYNTITETSLCGKGTFEILGDSQITSSSVTRMETDATPTLELGDSARLTTNCIQDYNIKTSGTSILTANNSSGSAIRSSSIQANDQSKIKAECSGDNTAIEPIGDSDINLVSSSGATIEAKSTNEAAIGRSKGSSNNTVINIKGASNVMAESTGTSSTIGGGTSTGITTVNIGENANVKSTNSGSGTAIGSSAYSSSEGNINISGNSIVLAKSSSGTAIGSGNSNTGVCDVNITGGTLVASGGESDIGKGKSATGNTAVKITGGNICCSKGGPTNAKNASSAAVYPVFLANSLAGINMKDKVLQIPEVYTANTIRTNDINFFGSDFPDEISLCIFLPDNMHVNVQIDGASYIALVNPIFKKYSEDGANWIAKINFGAQFIEPDYWYNNSSPTIFGAGSLPGSEIRIFMGETPLAMTTVSAEGSWVLTLPSLPDGSHSVKVQEYAGGIVLAELSGNINIDTMRPTVEVTVNSYPIDGDGKLAIRGQAEFEIKASDSLSGVKKIEYHRVSSEKNLDQGELARLDWTTANMVDGTRATFKADPANDWDKDPFTEVNKLLIKVTDNAGNITYMNSKSIFLYTDVEQNTENIYYTLHSDVITNGQINLNGNTINKITCAKSDQEGDARELTLDDYRIDGNLLVFKPSFNNSLSVGKYALNVLLNAGGRRPENTEDLISIEITLNILTPEPTFMGARESDWHNSNTPTIRGIGDTPGFTVEILTEESTEEPSGQSLKESSGTTNRLVGQTVVDEKGTWEITSNLDFGDGKHPIIIIRRNPSEETVLQYRGNINVDTTSPVARIKIGGSRWAGLYNTSNLIEFFRNLTDVTLEAEDAVSGVKKMEYYIGEDMTKEELSKRENPEKVEARGENQGKESNSESQGEEQTGAAVKNDCHLMPLIDGEKGQTLEESSQSKPEIELKTGDIQGAKNPIVWTNLNISGQPGSNHETTITLDPKNEQNIEELGKSFNVYLKVTDNTDNVVIIKSDGTILYEDTKLSAKKVYYTKGTKSDIKVKLALNGNTFLKIVNEATDKTLKAEKDCSAEQNSLTLFGSYLETLSPGTYTLSVYLNTLGINEPSGKIIKTALTLVVKEADKSSDKDKKDETDSGYTGVFDKIPKDDKIYKDAFETLSKKFSGKLIDLIIYKATGYDEFGDKLPNGTKVNLKTLIALPSDFMNDVNKFKNFLLTSHLKTIDLEDKIKEENKKYYLELNSFISGMHYSIVVLEK